MGAVSSSGRGRRRGAAEGLDLSAGALDGAAPLYDAVYAALCRVLMQGGVAAEQKLSVRAMAERLGTSATPVKEALRRLRADGVVYALPKSAFRIVPMPPERYRALLDIRVRLESLAAEAACRRAVPGLAGRLAALNARYRAVPAGDTGAFLAANQQFHFALYEAAGLPDLLDIIRGLWLRIGPHLGQAAGLDPVAASRHHDRLIEALRDGDAAAAGQAVRDDLESAAAVILPRLAESSVPMPPKEAP